MANISKNREKRSSNRQVVRTRRAGTPVEDHRVSSDERGYTDVEVDGSGNVVGTPFEGQGT